LHTSTQQTNPCLAHEDQTWTTRASRTTIFVGGQDRTTGKATRAAGSACGITHGKACAAIGPSGFADSVAASIPTSPGPKRYQNPFRHGSRAAEYVGVVSYPQPHPPGPLSASGASVGDAGGLSWPGAGPRQWGWCRLPIPTHTPQHAAPACALRGARTQPLVSWHPHRTCEGLGGCAAAPSVPSIP
jgi:hypothetical protein